MGTPRHEHLQCWKLAEALKAKVFALTARPLVNANPSYCDQIENTARLGVNHIVEGCKYPGAEDCARYLEMARGSLVETTTQLLDARRLGYIDNDELRVLTGLADRATAATTRQLTRVRRTGKPR
jgi:four helix bundle protein